MSSLLIALSSMSQALMIAILFILELFVVFPSMSHDVAYEIERSQFLRQGITAELPAKVDLKVPFTPQAPHGNWNLPYQEACEEASMLMVKHFFEGTPLNAELADREIVEVVKWQTQNGYEIDIDAAEALEVAQQYYGLDGYVYYDDEVTLDNIKRILSKGYPVIIPAAGRLLGNPNFTGAGPPYHMLVIIGYTDHYFITHDPGTRFGASFHYPYETIDAAIHDWVGSKDLMVTGRRAMLVLTGSAEK